MRKQIKLLVGLGFIGSVIPASLGESTVIGTYKAPTETTPAASSKGSDQATLTASNVSGESRDLQFEKKLVDALTNNPEIIVTALQKYNHNQEKARQDKLKASLTKYKDEIAKDSNAIVLGKKDSDFKLVVFVDPNCPHCRPFLQALIAAQEKYPNVAILIRHWAMLGNDSADVIRGLIAIKQQGDDKFKAATKEIATSGEPYTFAKLLTWVKDHKLSVSKFKTAAESEPVKGLVNDTKKLASEIGLEGTPTSLLVDKNGVQLVTPTDEKSLDSILSNASKGEPVKA